MKKTGNIKALLLFELLYKAAFLMVAYLAFTMVFRFLLKATGYSYLTIENLAAFLRHPVTVLVILLLVLLGTLLYLLESISLLVFYQGFVKEKRIRVVQILFPGIRETLYLLKQKGRLFLLIFAGVRYNR